MGDPPSRIAVVGPDDDRTSRARRAVGDAGGELVDPSSADADAVVALGDDAIHDVVRRAVESDGSVDADHTPMYPLREHLPDPLAGNTATVDDAVGNDRNSIDQAIRHLLDGTTRTVPHPVLAADIGGTNTYHAALDVALVTDEPARISEYGIEIPGRRHVTVRSDGVVVATPLGSEGYANAAGGPVITPGAGLAVVPIAPFTTRRDTWVVDGEVALSVERDVEAVSIVVDGGRRERIPAGRPVRIGVGAHVDLLVDGTGPNPGDGVDPATDRKGSNNS